MKIILSHENADFDAVASMLGAYKLNSEAIPVLPKNQHPNVREFLTLYRNGLPFVAWDDFNEGASVTHVTITDTARRLDVRNLRDDIPTLIIEHHPLKRDLRPHETWAGEIIGAATTLVVEQIRERKIALTSLEATVMALGIYSDTGSFLYGGTTVRDIRAAAWLLEQGAVLDTIQRFLSSPLNQDQQMLLEALMDHIDSRVISGFDVIVCTATVDKVIHSISAVVGVLRDILDIDALIVLVAMPDHVQLIARSITNAIHVGTLAAQFRGGGHPRAAAAAIHDADLDTVRDQVWHHLSNHIQPAQRVAHLMSHGQVQTVEADASITEIIAQLRRIGHEGYPVIEHDKIVGLLTLRDADKALEHGLKQSTVRDVMRSGRVTLSPDDPISLLEETMVNSDWGQIPIVDDSGALIGIVTRTDLIQHWAQTHMPQNSTLPSVDPSIVQSTLGAGTFSLIETIAALAQDDGFYLYMVGGIARDLLLERPNYDVDFVLEGDAIAFADRLQHQFGGSVHPYPPFGTSTWRLDAQVAETLGFSLNDVPDHLDFATARSELYDHPTALPTVYDSGIKLDLRRRDFTINTLAIQLSPRKHQWQILDFYGGMDDLQAGLIRVLHSLSFIDDPTRILRAVRFGERLQFTIEPRTAELIQGALPMLKRVTGERLQNELALMLKEKHSAHAFLKLEALGVLSAIHPNLKVTPKIADLFEQVASDNLLDWNFDSEELNWHVLMGQIEAHAIQSVTERLLMGNQRAKAYKQTALLLSQDSLLHDSESKPSEIVALLANAATETLVAVWIYASDGRIRERIEHYHDTWQHIKPTVDGHTLQEMGLQPGPHFRKILQRLRAAWIDGLVYNETQERALLTEIIKEVNDEHTG